ncbi:transposable element Tcb2 transposase [Trichonephila clavipes]|nr:transposable element Tcb2 transposase [Trichonephila clavipes]
MSSGHSLPQINLGVQDGIQGDSHKLNSFECDPSCIFSRRTFIWRESGTHCLFSYVQEINHYDSEGLVVWAGTTLDDHTSLYGFARGTGTTELGAYLVVEFLKSEDIRRMDWPFRSPDLIHMEHTLDALEMETATRRSTPKTLKCLKKELLNEWATGTNVPLFSV